MSNDWKINTLVLKLIFSGFTFAEESRFLKIFQSAKKKVNPVSYNSKKKNTKYRTFKCGEWQR